MSPRPDVSEARTHQILDAATEVFAEKGFHAARMDDIVQASGLSKGSLYWYFKSKDDLIIAIFDRMFNREFKALEELHATPGTASQRLLQFTDKVIADLSFMLRLMPIAYEFLALAFRNKTVQKAFKVYVNRYMEMLTPILQQGIDSGEFKPCDAKEAAIACGAIMEGTLLLWVYDHELVDPTTHIRSGIQLFLAGLQK